MYKNKWFFVILLYITALIIAGTAAYFSVFGLSKLFAGAGLSALVLFGAIEIGKIISVSVLYRFWSRFSLWLRSIFTIMVIGVMFITSMGIYGFLRNAYDQTSNQLMLINNETSIIEQRKNFILMEIDRFQTEINSKNNQIDTYIQNRTTQEQLVSTLYTQSTDENLTTNQSAVFRNRARETQEGIRNTDNLINQLRNENSELYSRISILNDSISNMDRQVLELNSTDIATEIGPLKYLSELTGFEMDDVVGVLIFLIIFVFDPFAIILIMAATALSIRTKEETEEIEERKRKKYEERKEKEKLSQNLSNTGNIFQKKISKIAQKYSDNRLEKKLNQNIKEFNDIKNNVNNLMEIVKTKNIDNEFNIIKNNINTIKNDIENNNYIIENLKNYIEDLENKIKDENDNELLENGLSEINIIKNKLNELNDKNKNEITKIKNDFKDLIKENDENKKIVQKLNNKMDTLFNKNNNDNIKEIVNEIKDDLQSELKDYIKILNKKIENFDKSKELYETLKNVKLEYDNKIKEITNKLEQKFEIIENIPGRNIRRAGARIPSVEIKKEI